MVSHRSIGIRLLASLWQLVMVTASFWGWLFIWQSTVLDERAALARYLVYNEFLLVGILFGAGGKRETHLQHEWVLANRRSVRQTFLVCSVFSWSFLLHKTPLPPVPFFSVMFLASI